MVGFFSGGMLTFGYLILIANVKVILFSKRYIMLNILITAGSFLIYILMFAVCSAIAAPFDLNAEFSK
jgi:hypothetical protein